MSHRADATAPHNTEHTKPIKVMFYTHGLVDGGGERLWAALATAFHHRGYAVSFVQDFEAHDNARQLDPNIPIITLGRAHVQSVKRLAQHLRDDPPDVALAAIGGSNVKLLLAKALARSKVKTAISFHGYADWSSGLLSFVTYSGLALLSRYSDQTIAVSQDLTDTLVTRWKAKRARVTTIINPVFVPDSVQTPSAQELSERPNAVLAVGRLVPEKDFATLIAAMTHVDVEGATLTILGKGPCHDALQAQIADLGLTSRVHLGGYQADPWSAYTSSKCLVLSSKLEVFGNVMVEALRFGLPVVATRCAGAQQILDDGRHGTLVPIGDAKALGRAISDTLRDPGDPVDHARRGADFSFEVGVPHYEKLVQDLVRA